MTGSAVDRLLALRQHRLNGTRAPHKPLLVLLALGQFARSGSSSLPWSEAETRLGSLLAEFGTSQPSGASSVAFPYTRLRTDGVWELSRQVANDSVSDLRAAPVEGHFTPEIESAFTASPHLVNEVARSIVESQFPMSIASDVLSAVGLNPDFVFAGASDNAVLDLEKRRRDAGWRDRILAAWDRSCAFCGFDGRLGGGPVGIEAAHIRWFNFEGPDDMDNGMALCSLHHKLLDRGVLGLVDEGTVVVSSDFSASSAVGRAVYDLHERELKPRRGTPLPALVHVEWHRTEVFKGLPLGA
jgi:putative restriction endonuclease